jgi:hypothetical protein
MAFDTYAKHYSQPLTAGPALLSGTALLAVDWRPLPL